MGRRPFSHVPSSTRAPGTGAQLAPAARLHVVIQVSSMAPGIRRATPLLQQWESGIEVRKDFPPRGQEVPSLAHTVFLPSLFPYNFVFKPMTS